MLIIKEKTPRSYRYRIWEEFTRGGRLTQSLSPLTAASWRRCLKAEMDPAGMNTSCVLAAKEMDFLMKKNSLLIEASQSNLVILERSLSKMPHAILLCDPKGNILYQSGLGQVLEYFQQAGLVVGGNCNEKVIGTTAPGIVLIEQKPAVVLREDHYSEIYHWCCCVASPIFNLEGHLIGCLDMTVLYDQMAHMNFLFGLNTATVQSIQANLRIQELLGEVEEAREIIKNTSNLTAHGLLVINNSGRIIHANKLTGNILHIPDQRLVGKHYREVIESDAVDSCLIKKGIAQGKVTFRHVLKEEKRYSVQARPLYDKTGQFIGSLLILEKEKMHWAIPKDKEQLAYYTFQDIIGEAPGVKRAVELAQKFALTDMPIILEGETGTGKEMFAQAIHNQSAMRKGQFVPVNCAAIPPTLFESELFGYSEGAFTGALRGGKKGKFEIAEGGTLFLDEINFMPVDLQAKLLRGVEGGGFFPLGAQMPKSFNARIVVATSAKIEEEIRHGRFLKELFYRLNFVRIFLPPLRERRGDLEQLVHFFLEESTRKFQKKVLSISPEVMQQLYSYDYDWPGNIRELKCCIEFSVCVADGEEILLEHLPDYLMNKDSGKTGIKSQQEKQHFEKPLILKALESTKGRIGDAAKILGFSRSTIYRKRKQLGLVKPHQK